MPPALPLAPPPATPAGHPLLYSGFQIIFSPHFGIVFNGGLDSFDASFSMMYPRGGVGGGERGGGVGGELVGLFKL